jgi:micrococcal nuclease
LEDGRHARYLGINTPERGQPFYEQARQANRRLVEGRDAWLVLDVQPTDQYGRILAYFWVEGRFINAELVRSGYANAYTQPPNVRFSEEIVAAEQEARRAKVGLWSPADIPIRIDEIHYDAPGPDHQNPNGEWVVLFNEGSEPIDLTGLTLSDEANHLFTFPPVRLEPGKNLSLHTGRGRDDDSHLYWGLVNDSVWNNDGDTAFLRDPTGRLIDSFGY